MENNVEDTTQYCENSKSDKIKALYKKMQKNKATSINDFIGALCYVDEKTQKEICEDLLNREDIDNNQILSLMRYIRNK